MHDSTRVEVLFSMADSDDARAERNGWSARQQALYAMDAATSKYVCDPMWVIEEVDGKTLIKATFSGVNAVAAASIFEQHCREGFRFAIRRTVHKETIWLSGWGGEKVWPLYSFYLDGAIVYMSLNAVMEDYVLLNGMVSAGTRLDVAILSLDGRWIQNYREK